MKYPIQKWKRFRHRRKKRDKPKRKPIPRIVVPSFFTLMNLFCGFLAILSISEGRLFFGAWLIVSAGLFDALDGFMARLSNATSQFGIELDSISDVVSFGVAPGFIDHEIRGDRFYRRRYTSKSAMGECNFARIRNLSKPFHHE